MHSNSMPNDDNQTIDASEPIAPPRSFASFLISLEQGGFHAELSSELQEIAGYLQMHANSFGGKPKGKMTITLDFLTEGCGDFEVRSDVKVSKPKMRRPKSIVWTDAANNLLPHNPRQMDMFAVKDVTRSNQQTKQL